MRISTRLAGFVTFVCLLLAGVCSVAWIGMNRIADELDNSADTTVPALVALRRLEASTKESSFQTRMAMLALAQSDDAAFPPARERFRNARADLEKAQGELAAHLREDDAAWNAYRTTYEPWKAASDEIWMALDARDLDRANEIVRTRAPAVNAAVEKALGEVAGGLERRAADGRTRGDRVRAASLWTLVVVGLAGIVLSILAGVALVLRIVRPLREISGAAARIAAGEVEVAVAYEGHDEIGQMADSFRGSLDYLRNVAHAAERLAHGDTSFSLEPRSERDLVARNILRARDSLRALLDETRELIAAARAGDLSRRADSSRFENAFADLVRGIDEMLDAVLDPIREAAQVLERLASRDLTARVTGDYRGDHAAIKLALNTAGSNLEESLAQIAVAADQVSAAAAQISSSSQAVASGASQQASALDTTSSSLEEMAGMGRQSAANAGQADVLARGALAASSRGTEAMERMNEAVARIRNAAEGTAAIIRDINEIAFQTNLLALNAAVEAARAGEAGRGFAVVAEEVRNLALRAKEAARKTEGLIGESIQHAERGGSISAEVSQQLREIVEGAGKVTAVVAEMAAANAEQARAIDGLGNAVAQMDAVTQQNAASAEESASAAEELSAQAQEVAALLARFRLSAGGPALRRVG